MEKFVFDVVSKTLTITSRFAKKLDDPENEEYKHVLKLQKDFPGLQIIQRTHKTPSGYKAKSGENFKRNQYKDITYERMERFMGALPNSQAYLVEYHKIRAFGEAARRNGYPIVRDWFLAQFPQFRKNPLIYIDNSPAVLPAPDFWGAGSKEPEENAA